MNYIKERNYFDENVRFEINKNTVEKLLLAYEKAIKKSMCSARLAISSGELSEIRQAQWDEAVVNTIESVLSLIPHTSDTSELHSDEEFMFPDSPNFE